MENGEGLSITSQEAPTRVVEAGEKRQYYLFREKDPDYPLELIITEVPPGHTQPFHAHETIDEITVVLHGEVVGITKDTKDSPQQEHPIQALSLYDPKVHDFHRITAAKDGTVLLVLEDRNTGEIFGVELPYDEGFNAGKAFHTVENRTDQWIIMATVKKTTPETFAKNPKIFQEDKINLE